MAFILCGPCKEHSEKEVNRKNNEGKGYGGRAVGNPIMILFEQKFLPDPSGIPDSGKPYEWFILTALVNIRRSITLRKCEVTAMRSSVRRLTYLLRPLALLAALRPKMPALHADSTVYFNKQLVIKIMANFTTSNIHSQQLARTLRNLRG